MAINVTRYALSRINQYTKRMYEHYWQTNPHAALVPKEFFDAREGLVPTNITLRTVLPTDYPDDLSNLALSTGTGNGCDVTATTVESGQDTRTFRLAVDAWASPVICSTDLEFTHNALRVMRNVEEGLMQYSVRRMADWHRIQNIGMVDNKAVFTAAGTLVEDENTAADFDDIILAHEGTSDVTAVPATTIVLDAGASAVDDTYNGDIIYITAGTGIGSYAVITDYTGATKTVTVADWLGAADPAAGGGDTFRIIDTAQDPAVPIDWDGMDYLYDQMERRGANSFAAGKADGEDVYPFILGPEIKRALFGGDVSSTLHVDIRYANEEIKKVFSSRGITRAYRGFVPVVDPFPIRLTADGTKIYPHTKVAAGTGYKYAANANYKPVSQSGLAVFEVATILPRETYACRPRPRDRAAYSKAGFTPKDYTAELSWINNRTFQGDNDLGDKGYYRCDWQLAPEARRPELGTAILFKIE